MNLQPVVTRLAVVLRTNLLADFRTSLASQESSTDVSDF